MKPTFQGINQLQKQFPAYKANTYYRKLNYNENMFKIILKTKKNNFIQLLT